MRIHMVYLGGSHDATGCESEPLELAPGATVADAAAAVVERHPLLAPRLEGARWAKNLEFASGTEALAEGDEVALLPPVCGGGPSVEITAAALDPEALAAAVAGPEMGATVVFLGTVRDASHGTCVSSITFEAYQDMAERQLERIAAAATDARPGCRARVAHRTGDLEVGEIAVVIATAAPHRDDAFTACREILERMKQDVPIWKKEMGPDGASWVGWDEETDR